MVLQTSCAPCVSRAHAMEEDAFSSCYILREDPCLFPLLQRLYKFGRGFFTVIGAVSALMQGMMIGPRMVLLLALAWLSPALMPRTEST